MRYIIFIVLLFYNASCNATEKIWIIDKSLFDMAKAVKNKICSDITFDNLDQLEAIKNLDIEINVYGNVRCRYYKFDAQLNEPISKLKYLHHTLEFWGEDNRTIVRGTLEIKYGRQFYFPWRWINLLKDRVINRVEYQILLTEMIIMMQLTK